MKPSITPIIPLPLPVQSSRDEYHHYTPSTSRSPTPPLSIPPPSHTKISDLLKKK